MCLEGSDVCLVYDADAAMDASRLKIWTLELSHL